MYLVEKLHILEVVVVIMMSNQLHQRPRSEASLSDEWSLSNSDFLALCNQHNLTPTLDVAATRENSKCPVFIGNWSECQNALVTDWNRGVFKEPHKDEIFRDQTVYLKYPNLTIYCNPPNSKTQKFIIKADEQWNKININIMMVIPINATVTRAGKKYIWDNPDVEIHPILPTPKFIYNGVQGESARNRYCCVIWRKKIDQSSMSK